MSAKQHLTTAKRAYQRLLTGDPQLISGWTLIHQIEVNLGLAKKTLADLDPYVNAEKLKEALDTARGDNLEPLRKLKNVAAVAKSIETDCHRPGGGPGGRKANFSAPTL